MSDERALPRKISVVTTLGAVHHLTAYEGMFVYGPYVGDGDTLVYVHRFPEALDTDENDIDLFIIAREHFVSSEVIEAG